MVALTAVSAETGHGFTAPAPVTLDERSRAILNQLRLVALDCRAAARDELFEACALLSVDRTIAKAAHAEAFMKCLPEAIGRAPKILRPGVEEVTFDEAWSIRLIAAADAGNCDSFDFLLRSRVAPLARRNIGFLIRSMSEQFCKI